LDIAGTVHGKINFVGFLARLEVLLGTIKAYIEFFAFKVRLYP
jgi:hypothetical protein